MTAYRYRTTLRPAGFGGVPMGVQWHYVELPRDHPGHLFQDTPRGTYNFGVIETDRPLTKAEMEHFDIIAVA